MQFQITRLSISNETAVRISEHMEFVLVQKNGRFCFKKICSCRSSSADQSAMLSSFIKRSSLFGALANVQAVRPFCATVQSKVSFCVLNRTQKENSKFAITSRKILTAKSFIHQTLQPQKPPAARPDKLFKRIELEVRSNDRQVIQSYIEFARMAAQNLTLDFQGP